MRGLAGKLGAAVASLAVALLLAECGLALLRPQDRSVWAHTRDGLAVHPASIETYLPRFGQRVSTNAWGMRDRPRALEKPEGSFRILVLGDSFMEALQVAFEESLPSLLEARLSERTGRRVEVLNGSTSGWGTDDEVIYLERYGTRFQPDLVLVAMTLHNDVSDNLALEHHDFRDGRIAERPRPQPSAAQWALIRARDLVATRSHLYSVYRRLKMVQRTRSDARALDSHVAALLRREPDARTQAGWEMTRQLLDRAREIAAQAGAQTAVFLIPLFIQVSEQRLERFLIDHELRAHEIELDRPQRVVAEWGQRAGVAVIDLTPELRAASRAGPALYLEGDGHWGREGHALAAQIVARELLARDLVTASAPAGG
jgi:hypothetical protein